MDVAIADLDDPRLDVASALTLLPVAERAALHRPSPAGVRQVLSRAILRHLLGKLRGEVPARIRLVRGAFGKPMLADVDPQHPCHFSVSRHGRWCAISIASRPVGVDIERAAVLTPDVEPELFTPSEVAALAATPVTIRAARGATWWAAKEAYLKATGMGLSVPPHRVVVGSGHDDCIYLELPNEDFRAWSVASFSPAPGVCGAVALRAAELVLALHSWEPPGALQRAGQRLPAPRRRYPSLDERRAS